MGGMERRGRAHCSLAQLLSDLFSPFFSVSFEKGDGSLILFYLSFFMRQLIKKKHLDETLAGKGKREVRSFLKLSFCASSLIMSTVYYGGLLPLESAMSVLLGSGYDSAFQTSAYGLEIL